MHRHQLVRIFALVAAGAGGLCLVAGARSAAVPAWQPPKQSLTVYASRQSVGDLEVKGLVAHPGYVRYTDLLRLPQIAATVADDPDYAGVTMRVTGVALEALARALGVSPTSDLIDALCTDGYRSHYPADYIRIHHPFLVLTVDGMLTSAWAAKAHVDDPGPYFILYDRFTPDLHVLSHVDRAQLPTNVVRLNFSTTLATFGSIAPRGSFAAGLPVQQGFTIAKQNCLRCHAQGIYGGSKAGHSWDELGEIAHRRPAFFAEYIRNPKAANPNAQMPGNPEYDTATLAALTAYFRTFDPREAVAR